MKTIFALLVLFLAIGIFARSDSRWTRVILSVGIIAMLLYVYIA